MNLVATIPFSFTAIIQAEEIRESFMERIRHLEAKLVEGVDLSDYGTSLQHISCCFVLIPEAEGEEEKLYEDIQEYLEEEQELYLQICLDHEEVISLEEGAYFEYLAEVYQQAFAGYEAFEIEEFEWENFLSDLEEILLEKAEDEKALEI
ncbi:MAG: hypothetical protein AAFP82_04990 [Bacteroidota bacterium]